MKPSHKKVKKGYENIRQVNYGLKLVYAVSKTGLDKFGSKGCD